MSRKIKACDLTFDMDNPEVRSFLQSLKPGGPYDHMSYINGWSNLRKVFEVDRVEVVDEKPVTWLKLDYSKMNPIYIEKYFDKKPEIIINMIDLKNATERFSEGGVDSAEMVMRRLSELYNKD